MAPRSHAVASPRELVIVNDDSTDDFDRLQVHVRAVVAEESARVEATGLPLSNQGVFVTARRDERGQLLPPHGIYVLPRERLLMLLEIRDQPNLARFITERGPVHAPLVPLLLEIDDPRERAFSFQVRFVSLTAIDMTAPVGVA